MTTTKAAGRTITAGELVDHFTTMDPNEPVKLCMYGDHEVIAELDENMITGPDDQHPYQSAYDLLEDLHEFKGTKAAMLKLVSDYITSP